MSAEAQCIVFHPSEVELADTITAILERVDASKPQRVVFDSLSELRILARDPLRYRRQILALKRHFAGRSCTVLLLDDRTAEGSHDLQLQSIAHGVVLMQSRERDFGIKRRRVEHDSFGHAGRRRVRVTIADTGTGIAPQVLPNIFEPFVTTKGETGTGLGLWVTSEIIKKNGWAIQVRSSTNPLRTGTAFAISIPSLRLLSATGPKPPIP